MIRAKGHFWLATRPEWVGELSHAGALVSHQAMGFWWDAIPKQHWPDHEEWRAHVENIWDPVYGDRRQEIVFIGTDMDEEGLRRRLDACLTGAPKATRMDKARWSKLADPFPVWKRAA